MERGRRHFVQISLFAAPLWLTAPPFEIAVRIEATLPCAGQRQGHTHRLLPKRDQYTHGFEELNLKYFVDASK